jgi:hypothetical protein
MVLINIMQNRHIDNDECTYLLFCSHFSNKKLRRFDFRGADLNNATICEGWLGIKLMKQFGNLPQMERYAARLNQAFMNILNHAIDV